MTDNQQAANATAGGEDKRTNKDVLRQYERVRLLKGQLVRAGLIDDDATPTEVIATVRSQIPADLF